MALAVRKAVTRKVHPAIVKLFSPGKLFFIIKVNHSAGNIAFKFFKMIDVAACFHF